MFLQRLVIGRDVIAPGTSNVPIRVLSDQEMIGPEWCGSELARVDARVAIQAFQKLFPFLSGLVQLK